MAIQVKYRRGSETEHTTFTGADGELTIDTTRHTAVIHDGVTAGGHPLATEEWATTLVEGVTEATDAANTAADAANTAATNANDIISSLIASSVPTNEEGVMVQDVLDDHSSQLNDIENFRKNNTKEFVFDWILGNLVSTTGAESSSTVRYRTSFYQFDASSVLFIIPDDIVCLWYDFDSTQTFIRYGQVPISGIVSIDQTHYYKFVARNSTTTAFDISVLDGLKATYNLDDSYQYIKYKEIVSLITSADNVDRLLNKTLICVGDSITYGANNDGVSYADMVSTRHSMTITKYAVSGAVIVPTIGRNCIQDQVDSAIATGVAPDFFLVSGGYNDSQSSVQNPLGALAAVSGGTAAYNGSYDEDTFIGGLESIFYKIKTAFPYAKILYILTYTVSAQPLWMTTYAPAIRSVCEKWAVKYTDFIHIGNMICNANLPDYSLIFTDGLHPNEYGNESMANYVEADMKIMVDII